jgi:soluble lytic murein transglycosylase-like protein
MRVSSILAIVAALLLSACATIRPVPAPPTVVTAPAERAPRAAVEPAPKEPELQIACVQKRSVDSWERRYRTQRANWEGHLEHPRRGRRYFPEVQRMVDEAGLPPEVAFLPTLESGYRSDVHGLGGSGLWQLGASTARRYGLVVSRGRDDRLNPQLSTKVAIRHLRYLYERYGDWPLALAAYNAGEGRVDRALRLSPGASFWDLAERGRLPPVTCAYVPKLLGLARVAHPDDCDDDAPEEF